VSLPAERASPPPVQVEYFDGPLDLLLDEVRRQNVPIEKIAMAPIVSRFLDYMETAADRSLNLDMRLAAYGGDPDPLEVTVVARFRKR
jgi:chromatin segregation and condensation protein Rec8/ScpA/Scc1 (kleisin family)